MSLPLLATPKLGWLFIPLLIVSCTHLPKKWDGVHEGSWTAKLLIKDKAARKSHVVNAEIFAVKHKKLRIDFTAGLGSHIASLVAKPEKVRYFLVKEKKYYIGPNRPGVLSPLFSVPLAPKYLHNILFEVPIKAKNWSCTISSDQLQKCINNNKNLIINWQSRARSQRKILINHPKAEVQIFVRSFRPVLKNKKTQFKLPAPKGFRVFRLRKKR